MYIGCFGISHAEWFEFDETDTANGGGSGKEAQIVARVLSGGI